LTSTDRPELQDVTVPRFGRWVPLEFRFHCGIVLWFKLELGSLNAKPCCGRFIFDRRGREKDITRGTFWHHRTDLHTVPLHLHEMAEKGHAWCIDKFVLTVSKIISFAITQYSLPQCLRNQL
jgi:hypothetical protein